MQSIGHITFLVREYNEAIRFFTEVLGFKLIEDIAFSEEKRWVVVRPNGSEGSGLLLAKAGTTEQQKQIGNQAGGRVFLFLQSNDFWRDYQSLKSKGVKFNEEPREESYGTVAVFEDLYGNKWDLLQLRRQKEHEVISGYSHDHRKHTFDSAPKCCS